MRRTVTLAATALLALASAVASAGSVTAQFGTGVFGLPWDARKLSLIHI